VVAQLGKMSEPFYIVPGRYARLDAYGNVERGLILQVLSQLRLFQGAETVSRNLVRRDGYRDDRSTRATPQEARRLRQAAFRRQGGQFFVVGDARTSGGLLPGIYQRQVASRGLVGPASRRPRPVFLFVSSVNYEQIFDFWRAGELAIERNYPRRLDEALARYAGAGLV
jgi:hypothetical protein